MSTTPTRIDPVEAARRIKESRYAQARLLLLAGSVMRGEATPTSDLDIVVVYDELPNAYRESFIFEGWPVETFVNDPETLDYYFHEVDRPSGCPSLVRMVLEGVEIPEPCELSASLKRRAASLIESGPPPLDEAELRRMRATITDLVDDLRYPRSKEELTATGARLYQGLADFYLRSQNLWSAKGKTIPRRLEEVNAEFRRSFCRSFEALFVEGRTEEIIALAEAVLQPHGGFLFEGLRLDAPPQNRKPLD